MGKYTLPESCSTSFIAHMQVGTTVGGAEAIRAEYSHWVKLSLNRHPDTNITIHHGAEHSLMLAQAFEKMARELRLHAPPEPVYFPRLHPVCASVGYPWTDAMSRQKEYLEGYEDGELAAKESVHDWYKPDPPMRP